MTPTPRITATPDPLRWHVQIIHREGGKLLRFRRLLTGTRDDVERQANAIALEMSRPSPAIAPARARSLGSVWEEFRRSYLGKPDLSPATLKSWDFVWERYIAPEFDCMAIPSIDAPQIAGFQRRLAADKKPGTVNMIVAKLRAMLGWCYDHGLVASLPKIRALRVQASRDAWADDEAMDILAFAYQSAMLAAGGGDHAMLAKCAIVLIAGMAGLRCSEIIGLQVTDIKLAPSKAYSFGYVDVRHNGVDCRETKSKRARKVPLTSELATVLRAVLAAHPTGAGHALVRAKGERVMPLSPAAVAHACDEIATDAGYPPAPGVSHPSRKGRGPHRWRHTFVTTLLHAGIAPATVRDLAGHSSLRITDLYLHPSGKDLARDLAQAWAPIQSRSKPAEKSRIRRNSARFDH